MQLEDGHSLFDYDVGLNDIIQLMVRPPPPPASPGPQLPASSDEGEGETVFNGVATTAAAAEKMEVVREKGAVSAL